MGLIAQRASEGWSISVNPLVLDLEQPGPLCDMLSCTALRNFRYPSCASFPCFKYITTSEGARLGPVPTLGYVSKRGSRCTGRQASESFNILNIPQALCSRQSGTFLADGLPLLIQAPLFGKAEDAINLSLAA